MTSRDERGGELSEERLRELRDYYQMIDDANKEFSGCKAIDERDTVTALDELLRRRASAPSMAGTITDTQVHRMCGYLQERCNKCPREIDTAYGRGTQGCYAIALETLEKARELLSPPSPPLRRESEGEPK